MRRYEYDDEIEERTFSWTDLFIKVIIVLIFILFTVWLISLPNRKNRSSTDNVITNVNAFSENINQMRDVGQSYFTTERLPEKVGDVKKITLERMYKNKMLLTLKDKNGKACSAKNSYVSVEKMNNEYQMKVYLECGDDSDYIIVTMGCYDYCKSADVCEKKTALDDETEGGTAISNPNTEYQYSKSTGGVWGAWSQFSNWLTTSVAKNDYTDVETKVVSEYDDNGGTTRVLMGVAKCPAVNNYRLASNVNGVCTYVTDGTSTTDPTCPSVSGYTLSGRNGFTCNYSKSGTSTTNPICPSVSGYTLSGRSGFTCNYSKSGTSTANPTCPSVSGYTLSGRSGFTCNYSKTSTSTTNPICPSVSGYKLSGRNGFTCNYSKTTTSSNYTLSYYGTGSGRSVPADTKTYHYVKTSATYGYPAGAVCDNYGNCAKVWTYTYKIYKKNYSTVTTTTTKTATCPTGYSKSGSTCARGTTSTTTKTATCPSGYYQSGSTCAKGTISTTTRTATCPSGYYQSGSSCVQNTTSTTTRTATCPNGYTQSGDICSTNNLVRITKRATCPSGQVFEDGKCFATYRTTKNVTYYRYRTRNYINGSTDYKWSKSNSDTSLLNAGYKLTGTTRTAQVEK